jgi:hypothetical protein
MVEKNKKRENVYFPLSKTVLGESKYATIIFCLFLSFIKEYNLQITEDNIQVKKVLVYVYNNPKVC